MRGKIVLLIMMLLLCLSSVAYAGEVNITVDGELIATKGVIVNNRTLVPLDEITKQFGLKVIFNNKGWFDIFQGELPRGTIKGNDYTVIYAINYLKNGRWTYRLEKEDYVIDTPLQVINNKTMVPLKMITDILEAGLGWDGATNTATIKSWQVLAKERDEAKLQAQLADGSVIDIISDMEGMDSKRDRLGGTLDQRGLTVKSLKAEWDEKENQYWITYQIYNTSGKDMRGNVYYKVCMFDKETGKVISESRKRDTSLNAGEGSQTAEMFPTYDPTKHAIDILLSDE